MLFEPQDGGSVDGVLKDYADQVKKKVCSFASLLTSEPLISRTL